MISIYIISDNYTYIVNILWVPTTLPTRDNFVHCNHNLLSSKTTVATNPPLGNSKPPNFGKPMDYSHHFHRVCYTGFRPTCAYRVLACGGAWELY